MKTITYTAILMTVLFLSTAVAGQCDDAMKEGEAKFNMGKYEEAITAFSKCLDADPGNMNAHLQRATAYNFTKQYEKAIADYNVVLEGNPNKVNILNSRGSCYQKLKKYDKAVADFNKVISLDPKNEDAYNNRGWCKKKQGDDKGACDDWKQSKKLGNSEAKIFLKEQGC